mgnify:CR=1 FL=1
MVWPVMILGLHAGIITDTDELGQYLLEWMSRDTLVLGILSGQIGHAQLARMDVYGSFVADCLHTCFLIMLGGYKEREARKTLSLEGNFQRRLL